MINRLGKVLSLALILITLVTFVIGCAKTERPSPPTEPKVTPQAPQYPIHSATTRFRIATTTSLYDTGLWYYLEPMFEEYASVEMDIVYAGTGIALEYGRCGDVDAVVVHSRVDEDKFIAEGYGINRRYFAYNFFLIAGPETDPTAIKGLAAIDAFKKIAEEGIKNPDIVKFVSRGDQSGTHVKEQGVWQKAGYKYEDIQKSGKWYVEAGKGMEPCLLMASEQQAYILTDISTFTAYKGKLSLVSLVEAEEPTFLNVYAVMAINPDKVPTTKIDVANKFINWLISPEVQNILGTYGKAEFGKPLFRPTSDGSCQMEGCPTVEEYSKTVP